MRATFWILLWGLLLMQFGCTSKPLSHNRPESDQKATTEAQASSSSGQSSVGPVANAGPETQKDSSATLSDSKRASDLDEIAKQAELEEARRLKKTAEPVVLEPGTMFYIHLSTEVGSKVSQPGDNFEGTLAAPVASADHVIIPAGTSVGGRVVQAKRAGRFKGGAILALELTSISVRGKKYLVHSQMVTTESKGKGKRTAGMVAGSAAGGAVVGGIAGGGKGAAIGTAVGATAGGTVAALTGNRDITLPVETIVAFRLSSPLEIGQPAASKAE